MIPSLGKPAQDGEEIVERRARVTMRMIDLSNHTVLDYGCGNGVQTKRLASLCKSLDGVDLYGPYTVYDGKRLPFADGTFDTVVSYQVLEHVASETDSLAEIWRVLKHDGYLLVSVPNRWWIFETHGWVHRIPFVSWLPKPLHDAIAVARIYDKQDIIGLLSSHGFALLGTAYMVAPMDRAPRWAQRVLRKIVFHGDTTDNPFVSTEIFVLCQRIRKLTNART